MTVGEVVICCVFVRVGVEDRVVDRLFVPVGVLVAVRVVVVVPV